MSVVSEAKNADPPWTTRKRQKEIFLKMVENSFQERNKLLYSKGKAYSGNTDPFKNFKENAERLGLSKYQVWAIYAFKHIDSISNAIKQDPQNPIDASEGLKGRIHDAQNYLDLLYGMLVEDNLIEH